MLRDLDILANQKAKKLKKNKIRLNEGDNYE